MSLRTLRNLPAAQAAIRFEQLRTEYAFRPEFRHFTVELNESNRRLADTFSALGFRVGEE
jgi:hypothetical protein